MSSAGSEHFGRPVTTHIQSPLSLSTLQRDRTVAGHKEKGHYQKTLYLPPRIARTPSTTQPGVNQRPIDSFICKYPDKPEFIIAARGGLLRQGKVSGSAAYWPYYHLEECSWSLLPSQMYTGAGALVRDFYIDTCIYRAQNAQHKHHLPPFPHTPTHTHMHTPTRDSALGHGATQTAHPAASV